MAGKPGVKFDRSGRLDSARFSFGGMNFLVDPADIDIESGVCTDIKNCDVDYKQNAQRRKGYTRKLAVNATCSWANGTYAYNVVGGELYSFNGTTNTKLTSSPTGLGKCEFKQVNNIVVFSDGTQIGTINGTTCTMITRSYTDNDVAAVATWVTSHYPANPASWNGVDSNSNFSVDAFKLATTAGTCLEYYNGILYFAVNNFIFCTKAFDIENMDMRFNVVAGFPDNVTMIARVNDGLYVGTTNHVYWLGGTGFEAKNESGSLALNFTQKQIVMYGAVKGSNVRCNASLVPSLQATDTCVLFTTSLGVFAGGNGGHFVNLSDQQINITVGIDAAAYFRDIDGIYQYLVCFNTSASLYSAWDSSTHLDTIVVNTINNHHSRYTNFAFNGFFRYGHALYGSNARGIYLLEGATDFVGEDIQSNIDGWVVTPATDFGVQEKKMARDAFLHGRFSGEMQIDFFVDEGDKRSTDIIYFDGSAGIHRKRVELPLGIRGTDWQFKVKNVNGSDFTLIDLEIAIKQLQRTV